MYAIRSYYDQFSKNPDAAELDVLATTGEQVSIALFSMLCKDAGLKARSLLGSYNFV